MVNQRNELIPIGDLILDTTSKNREVNDEETDQNSVKHFIR